MAASASAAASDSCVMPSRLAAAVEHMQSKALEATLDEYYSKVGIDSASIILADTLNTAQKLVNWVQQGRLDLPYSISVPAEAIRDAVDPMLQKAVNLDITSRIQDDHFSHVISNIESCDPHKVSRTLRQAYYALKPKGVAVVTIMLQSPAKEITQDVAQALGTETPQSLGRFPEQCLTESQLITMAEEAQFERGKIRCVTRESRISGNQLQELTAGLRGTLASACGGHGVDLNRNAELDNIVERQVREKGGLEVKFWLVMAMKWDLLCA